MGNVQFLLAANNSGLEKYTYDVFGQPKITNWAGTPLFDSAYGNRFMFTGREYLTTLGIYDYRHRFYHPGLGRFLEADPTGFGGEDNNLFRYAGHNPANAADPMGTTPESFQGLGSRQNGIMNHTALGFGSDDYSNAPGFGGGSGISDGAFGFVVDPENAPPRELVFTDVGVALVGNTFFNGQLFTSVQMGATWASSPTMNFSLAFTGFGSQNWYANRAYADGIKAFDPNTIVATRDSAAWWSSVLVNAAQHGALNLNVYGYSRGAIAAVDVGNAVARVGGNVHIAGLDPVVLTHFNNRGIPIDPNVSLGTSTYQAGRRWGLFDFPGTPFRSGPNVLNVPVPDDPNGFIRHENMPRLVYPVPGR